MAHYFLMICMLLLCVMRLQCICCYRSNHLLDVPYSDGMRDALKRLAYNHLLFWLEVMSVTNTLDTRGGSILTHAISWIGVRLSISPPIYFNWSHLLFRITIENYPNFWQISIIKSLYSPHRFPLVLHIFICLSFLSQKTIPYSPATIQNTVVHFPLLNIMEENYDLPVLNR